MVDLGAEDLNEVKRRTTLLTRPDGSDSFAAVGEETIDDLIGNSLTEIQTFQALRARNYIADISPPELNSFVLDISGDAGVLVLNFSETVQAGDVNHTSISLQAASNSSLPGANPPIALTGGLVLSNDSTSLTIELAHDDLNLIKATTWLATYTGDTYIVLSRSSFKDMNNNSVVAVSQTDALQASEVVPDSTLPTLGACELNMNIGILQLSFSETVDGGSFAPSSVRIQNNQDVALMTESYLFRSSTTHNTDYNEFVTLAISEEDQNELKAFVNLATTTSDTQENSEETHSPGHQQHSTHKNIIRKHNQHIRTTIRNTQTQ